MKQRIQCIAALFMAMSAGMASAGPGSGPWGPFGTSGAYGGYGPYAQRVSCDLEPVREVIMIRPTCIVQPRVIVRESSCLMESPRTTWRPLNTIGNVVSTPFRAVGSTLAWTGRTLSGERAYVASQPTYLGSRTYLAPVGERFTTTKVISSKRMLLPVGEKITTVTTYKKSFTHHKWSKKHHLSKSITYRSSSLLPVGEKITTVKYLHSKRMLQPVGERITTVKTYRSGWLQPVGERITTVRYLRSDPMLMPVGERFVTRKVFVSRPLLQPVGERITTIRYIKMRPVLEPVGERTIIRTSRVFVQPLNSCSYSGFNPYW